tara:strand:+ start:183 stop:620 length:438 start_codon:yes stop_codon:yes gene_type:complete
MNIISKKMINYKLYKSDKIINPKGNLTKLISISDTNYKGFGELYFSDIKHNQIKGWKKHKKMDMNIFLIEGKIKIVLAKIKNKNFIFKEILLTKKKQNHLFLKNNVYFAFQGVSKKTSRLMNFSNIIHDSKETSNIDISEIKYKW